MHAGWVAAWGRMRAIAAAASSRRPAELRRILQMALAALHHVLSDHVVVSLDRAILLASADSFRRSS